MTYAEQYLKLTQDPRFDRFCAAMQITKEQAIGNFMLDLTEKPHETELFEEEINSIQKFYDSSK